MANLTTFRSLVFLVPFALLTACTGLRGPDTTPAPAEEGEPAVEAVEPEVPATTEMPPVDVPVVPMPPSYNPAVLALLDTARADASAGRLPTATAAVERALRIESRNPALWQELAVLKLQKGEYQQAENLAVRSNSWASANKPLMARNWRIISEARSLRGDYEGAKAALDRAMTLDPDSAPLTSD